MLWIGLTGGIGTGKSTVGRLLKDRGYAVIDADELAREAVQIGTAANLEIGRVFGPDAVMPSGELNRARIGEVVFSDRTKLLLLESIIHPRVRQLATERRQELQKKGLALAFYDVPLLFEKSMESLFDQIVVVASTPELQRSRLISRNGFSKEEVEKRIGAQMAIEQKKTRADDIIENNGSIEDLGQAVDTYLGKLRSRLPGPS